MQSYAASTTFAAPAYIAPVSYGAYAPYSASAALALDAADGHIDGSFYGRCPHLPLSNLFLWGSCMKFVRAFEL